MEFEPTAIDGVTLIHPRKIGDDRGHFMRAFCEQEFADAGLPTRFVQCNLAVSKLKGTMRGLHFQTGEHAEAKLMRCVQGAIFDVAVDIDPDSPTYLQWVGVELSAENGLALLISEKCAHGYLTLTDDAVTYYHSSAFYAPDAEGGLHYADPAVGIRWPIEPLEVSDKDRAWQHIEQGASK